MVPFNPSAPKQTIATYTYSNMNNNYERLFQNLTKIETPENLGERILVRINLEEKKRALWRLALFAPLALASSVGVFFAFLYATQEVAQSGFLQYLSVAVSDGGTALAYWKELSVLLAESAPILGTVVFLGAILVLLGSLKSAIKNAQTVFTPTLFAH